MRPVRRLAATRRVGLRSRHGFTILELTTAIVILGIIGGIAYAAFGGAMSARVDGGAEAVMNDVVIAQEQLFSDYGSYSSWSSDLGVASVGADLLEGDPSTSPDQVSMAVGTRGTLGLAVRASDRECRVVRLAPLTRGGAQSVVDVDGSAPCRAALAFEDDESAATQVGPVRLVAGGSRP